MAYPTHHLCAGLRSSRWSPGSSSSAATTATCAASRIGSWSTASAARARSPGCAPGALRGGGLVTVAKTTGTAARFINPDGQEEPVYRKFGMANIVEQIGIVRRAAAYSPDALVIECMAVMPDLQEVNERKLIRSTICVICNVREDHLAEMGPDPRRRRPLAVPVDADRRDLRDRRAGPGAHPAGRGRPPRLPR